MNAQQAPGFVIGHLIDPNGNTAKGLEATSTRFMNVATRQEVTAVISQSSGGFTATIPAGTYDVTIPIACCLYRSFSQKAFSVAAGQSLRLDPRCDGRGLPRPRRVETSQRKDPEVRRWARVQRRLGVGSRKHGIAVGDGEDGSERDPCCGARLPHRGVPRSSQP